MFHSAVQICFTTRVYEECQHTFNNTLAVMAPNNTTIYCTCSLPNQLLITPTVLRVFYSGQESILTFPSAASGRPAEAEC